MISTKIIFTHWSLVASVINIFITLTDNLPSIDIKFSFKVLILKKWNGSLDTCLILFTKPAKFGKKKWADGGAADLGKHLLLGIFGAFLGLAPGGEELCRDGEAVDWQTWWKIDKISND